MTFPAWKLGPDRSLSFERPRVLAILNLTPDSFSDGGRLPTVEAAVAAARAAVEAGADMLDLGGESTRPGSKPVSAEEQIRRVVPVVQEIRRDPVTSSVLMSVDTTRAAVARAAIEAGVDAINDTSAGMDDPEMFPLAAESGRGLVLMHRLRRPAEDSYSDRYSTAPIYSDVVFEVMAFLKARAQAAMDAGVARESIVLDSGLGFGKTVEQNLELIRRTGEFAALGFPIMSGASRKSFVGRAAGLGESAPGDRSAASVAVSVLHYIAGAMLFRVHDVAWQVQALRAAAAIRPPD